MLSFSLSGGFQSIKQPIYLLRKIKDAVDILKIHGIEKHLGGNLSEQYVRCKVQRKKITSALLAIDILLS